MSENRSTVVCARFTDREAARLRDLAGKRKVSEWVRDLVLRHLRIAEPPIPSLPVINETRTSASPAHIWWSCNAAQVTGPPSASYVWITAASGSET